MTSKASNTTRQTNQSGKPSILQVTDRDRDKDPNTVVYSVAKTKPVDEAVPNPLPVVGSVVPDRGPDAVKDPQPQLAAPKAYVVETAAYPESQPTVAVVASVVSDLSLFTSVAEPKAVV